MQLSFQAHGKPLMILNQALIYAFFKINQAFRLVDYDNLWNKKRG